MTADGESRRLKSYFTAAAALLVAAVPGGPAVLAAEARTELRVCADPNYLPYSSEARDGFENRIAAMLAEELGLSVEYEWFPQRMGFIRNTLRAQREEGGYKCDLVMGLPAGYELAITTDPYYYSSYALVYVKGRRLDDVKSAEDIMNMDLERRSKIRFGLAERNPGAVWLARNGMLDAIVMAFAAQSGDPHERPGQAEQEALLADRIDATVMWGPIAGHFARTTEDVDIAIVPMQSSLPIRFHFGISAGVRFGEKAWKDQIQALLNKRAADIRALLEEFKVPLVDENGNAL
ncbi:MAG: quinoprotein dehydrogenase-associated putative ABC transporter substrate-binding protein [Gammaproteobacteria bacterium]